MWALPNYLFTIQNGYLAFYNDSDGAITAPNAEIDYDAGTPPQMNVTCGGDININAGQTLPAEVDITNGGNGFLQLSQSGSFLTDTSSLTLQSAASLVTFGVQGSITPPGGVTFDFDGGFPGMDAYSLNGGSNVGIYDTVFGGLTFSGGLLTDDSSSYSIPWAGITGTPTTLSGYGITDAVPMPVSPVLGYVLTWNGSAVDWEPGGGGGTPTSIANGGSTLALDGSGNLTTTLASGELINLGNYSDAAYLEISSIGQITLYSNGRQALAVGSGGDIQLARPSQPWLSILTDQSCSSPTLVGVSELTVPATSLSPALAPLGCPSGEPRRLGSTLRPELRPDGRLAPL